MAARGSTKLLAAVVVAGVMASGAGTKAGHHAIADLTAATGGSDSANVALGRKLAAGRGWTGAQWTCLDELWTRESGWSSTAANPESDARGIPQDIHGWADYPPGQPRPQIVWGLDYIGRRYQTPCGAWSHEQAEGWY